MSLPAGVISQQKRRCNALEEMEHELTIPNKHVPETPMGHVNPFWKPQKELNDTHTHTYTQTYTGQVNRI